MQVRYFQRYVTAFAQRELIDLGVRVDTQQTAASSRDMELLEVCMVQCVRVGG
jgi:hypothetical protein